MAALAFTAPVLPGITHDDLNQAFGHVLELFFEWRR